MTTLTGRKAAAVVTALVALVLAASVYLTVKVTLPGYDSADEQARKRALEAALRRGRLSLHDAQYWRPVTPPQGDEP